MAEQNSLFIRNKDKEGFPVSPFSPEYIPAFITNEAEIIRSSPDLAGSVVKNIRQQKLKGKDERFIDLIDLLIFLNKYWDAFVLCRYALSVCRKKGDIYAGLIESMIELGIAADETSTIQGIVDEEYEDFQTFRFCRAICHFYEDTAYRMRLRDPKREIWIQRGLLFAEKLKSLNPRSEQGYYFEIKLLYLKDEKDAARRLQRIVLFEHRPPELKRISMDSKEILLCPECYELFVNNLSQQGTEMARSLIKEIAKEAIRSTKTLLEQELPPQEKKRLMKIQQFFEEKRAYLRQTMSPAIELNVIESVPISNMVRTEPNNNLYKE